jgi:hypothetical protein
MDEDVQVVATDRCQYGELVLCCQDYQLRHVLGNLMTHTIQEVLSNPTTEAIRHAMATVGDCLCRYCDYVRRR